MFNSLWSTIFYEFVSDLKYELFLMYNKDL